LEYVGILILLGFVMMIALGSLIFSNLFGPSNSTREKRIPYECGVDPIGSARERYPIKYYLVAILFLLFDIEFLFMIILALMFASPGESLSRVFLFAELVAFLVILGVGYVYIWRKGALEWD
jgi:NADH-quinone oxidoreductase subunit A